MWGLVLGRFCSTINPTRVNIRKDVMTVQFFLIQCINSNLVTYEGLFISQSCYQWRLFSLAAGWVVRASTRSHAILRRSSGSNLSCCIKRSLWFVALYVELWHWHWQPGFCNLVPSPSCLWSKELLDPSWSTVKMTNIQQISAKTSISQCNRLRPVNLLISYWWRMDF